MPRLPGKHTLDSRRPSRISDTVDTQMIASRARKWFTRMTHRRLTRRPAGLTARRRPLDLERLEDRLAPAQVNWTGGGDNTSWNDPLNWSGHQLPTSADDVTISNPSTVRVVHSTGTDSINSLTSQND